MVKNLLYLLANLISTKVTASNRKSTQVHASLGQTQLQIDPSFQLASTCDSVWPEINGTQPRIPTVEPAVSDHVKCQAMLVAYGKWSPNESVDNNGPKLFVVSICKLQSLTDLTPCFKSSTYVKSQR